MVTNNERADAAQEALNMFTALFGSSGEAETDLADLIGDLLHLARRTGANPLRVAEAGLGAWHAEEFNQEPYANDDAEIIISRHRKNIENDSPGLEVAPHDEAEQTGGDWIKSATYSVRPRGDGTECIRHSDDARILVQGSDAEELCARLAEFHPASHSAAAFDSMIGPLFK